MSDPLARVCAVCNDTHWLDTERGRIMCTRCPVPCQQCRNGGIGAFCETTPCPCKCHSKRGADDVSSRLSRRSAPWLHFNEGTSAAWGFPDPKSEALNQACYKARHFPDSLTESEKMTLATFVDAVCSALLTDGITTGAAIEKLRAIRNATQETER